MVSRRHHMKRLIAFTLLAVTLFAPPTRALPAVPLPSFIYSDSTSMVMFMWGMIDGRALVEARKASPTPPAFSLRDLAGFNEVIAFLLLKDTPQAFAYYIGRATALNDEADMAAELPR